MQQGCLRGLMLVRFKDLLQQQQSLIYIMLVRTAGVKVAQDAIIQVLTDLHICPVDCTILEQAIALNF